MSTVNNQVVYEVSMRDGLTNKLRQADGEAEKLEHSMGELAGMVREVGTALGFAFGVERIIEYGKQVLEVTAEFEGFANRIKFASENSVDAQENIGFLKQEIIDLHLPMKQVYEGFSEMEAGLKGTEIEGQNLRVLFDGISKAAATTHLPTAQLDRMMYDLKEIGEIGLNKRLINSLNTTGIGPAVKATFGKTMVELEKEGMSGVAFLEKLGPGLAKYFSSGLAQYGESLQAQMTDTQNAITKKTVELGEDLKPAYLDIMHTIQSALNSEPVDFLIQHMQQLVSIVGFAGESWLIYKGITTAVSIAEGIQNKATEFGNTIRIAQAASFRNVTEAEIKQLIATGELTQAELAYEASVSEASAASIGFGLALDTIAPIALVAGIAELVNLFMKWNDELNKSVENVTHLKQLTQKGDIINSSYQEDITNAKEFAAGKFRDQDPAIIQEAYNKTLADSKAEQKHILDLQLQINEATAAYHKMKDNIILIGANKYSAGKELHTQSGLQIETENQINNLKTQLSQAQGQASTLHYAQSLYEKSGLKPIAKKIPEGIDPTKETKNAHGSKALTINVKIGDLVKELNIHSTTIQGGAGQMKALITEYLTGAVNDSQRIGHD